jgi:anti-sigma B factor antagonist
MKISEHEKDGVSVLEPHGKLLGGVDTGELDEKLYALLHRGIKAVVIDLKDTQYINSSGLSLFLLHRRKLRESGGGFRLANPTASVMRILVITRLETVFDIFDSLDAAVASFKD